MSRLVMLDLDGTLLDSKKLYFIGVHLITKKWLGLHLLNNDPVFKYIGEDVTCWADINQKF